MNRHIYFISLDSIDRQLWIKFAQWILSFDWQFIRCEKASDMVLSASLGPPIVPMLKFPLFTIIISSTEYFANSASKLLVMDFNCDICSFETWNNNCFWKRRKTTLKSVFFSLQKPDWTVWTFLFYYDSLTKVAAVTCSQYSWSQITFSAFELFGGSFVSVTAGIVLVFPSSSLISFSFRSWCVVHPFSGFIGLKIHFYFEKSTNVKRKKSI